MNLIFEEIDFQQTALGDISLRRRSEPVLDGVIVYEIRLNDEFLMSSLFNESEVQLSRLGLAALHRDNIGDKHGLNIVVGGLGLGYTAAAALQDPLVSSLTVIDVMEPVVEWHRRGLVPLGPELTSDPRCNLVTADFFGLATTSEDTFDFDGERGPVHAVLVDIDHSPTHWLNKGNGIFYSETGLTNAANKLVPRGVFGLWSNDPPDDDFMGLLQRVFESAEAHIVSFANPYTGGESSNTVYIARTCDLPY